VSSGEERAAGLRTRWRDLGADLGVTPSVEATERWTEIGGALLAAYGAGGRAYHDLDHLVAVLDSLDELWPHPDRPVPAEVRAAAWFHDAVYDPSRAAAGAVGEAQDGAGRVREPMTDEARSAAWARRALASCGAGGAGGSGGAAARAARLVEATAGHRLVGELVTVPGAVCFLDADLAVLGADPTTYDRYVEAVRAEYVHLGDAAFDRGRLAVLLDLRARPHLYLSARGRERFEVAARANLAREIAARRAAVGADVSGGGGAGRRGGAA
jgi:predicted metal-dependent HD superfamily phosphohydrolase